ncbi:MAG: methyltransferase domain-containing protein [Candidatus Eiseniibacteriota bacterium]
MKIGRDDLVLEIGSGNNPRPRADILCDRFIEDDAERGGAIVADRPLVEADARALPFADQAFDYVICSHVLEHVEDPERMLRELMRVARRGYIETPSEIAERLYGWPFHESVINRIGGKLVIRKKSFRSPFGRLFHVLAERDRAFGRFHATHPDLLLVRHEWDGTIDFEILPGDATPIDLEDEKTIEAIWRDIDRGSWRDRLIPTLKGLVPRRLVVWGKSLLSAGRRKPKKGLREIVVCPACRGPVTWRADRITCDRCGQSYPIVGAIPRLVAPSLTGSGGAARES